MGKVLVNLTFAREVLAGMTGLDNDVRINASMVQEMLDVFYKRQSKLLNKPPCGLHAGP